MYSKKDKDALQAALEALRTPTRENELNALNKIIGDDSTEELTADAVLEALREITEKIKILEGRIVRNSYYAHQAEETGDNVQTVAMYYDSLKNTVTIDAKQTDLEPRFLKYLLQSKDIPEDAKVTFLR